MKSARPPDKMLADIKAKTGLEEGDIRSVYTAMLFSILDSLEKGEKVLLRNFGRFEVIKPNPHKIRDPKTGGVGYSRVYLRVRFKPSRILRGFLRNVHGRQHPEEDANTN